MTDQLGPTLTSASEPSLIISWVRHHGRKVPASVRPPCDIVASAAGKPPRGGSRPCPPDGRGVGVLRNCRPRRLGDECPDGDARLSVQPVAGRAAGLASGAGAAPAPAKAAPTVKPARQSQNLKAIRAWSHQTRLSRLSRPTLRPRPSRPTRPRARFGGRPLEIGSTHRSD